MPTPKPELEDKYNVQILSPMSERPESKFKVQGPNGPNLNLKFNVRTVRI